MSKHSIKYLYLIFAFLFLLFFSNDFGLIDLQKTAIIVGIGLDKADDNIKITAQIAIPEQKGSSTSVKPVSISGLGMNVNEALDEINRQTSWYPNLSNCNIMLFGESMINENLFAYLEFFLKNEFFPDTCLLAACKGEAATILSDVTPLNDITSIALQKILSDTSQKSGNLITNNLKNFAINNYDCNASSFLPYVTETEQTAGGKADESNSETNGDEEGGQSAQKNRQSEQSSLPETQKIFDASRLALYSNGIQTDVLDARQTFAVNLLRNKLKLATYDYSADVDINGVTEKKNVGLSLSRNKFDVSLDLVNGAPTVKIKLTARAQIVDIASPTGVASSLRYDSVYNALIAAAEDKLVEDISSALTRAAQANCDLLNLRRQLYNKHFDEFFTYTDGLLAGAAYNISVDLEGVN